MIRRSLSALSLRICRGVCLVILALIGFGGAFGLGAARSETILVAAASDLRFVMPELSARFTRHSGIAVRVSLGASGNFARQIRAGAPFDVFLSADAAYVQDLVARGLTQGPGKLYAEGRLALFAPHNSPLRLDSQLKGVRDALLRLPAFRFAIANPDHAPYGRAAREALRRAGLWEGVKPRLILGENVSQAARFAASGQVTGALIAHALAKAPALKSRGRFVLVARDMHPPLQQTMVLLKGAKPAARRFFAFLQGQEARAILARHGFTLPQE